MDRTSYLAIAVVIIDLIVGNGLAAVQALELLPNLVKGLHVRVKTPRKLHGQSGLSLYQSHHGVAGQQHQAQTTCGPFVQHDFKLGIQEDGEN